MTAKIIDFPSSVILRAARQLVRPSSPEAEGMAASVLIEALISGERTPPETLNLVCSALMKHARTRFGVHLAEKLAELDDRVEVLVLGQILLDDKKTRAAGLALLRRLG